MRWFLSHLPDDGSVTVTSEGLGLCGLTIAGPNARSILASLTCTDVSHDAFKFMAVKQMDIGMVPALVGRVSYTGDLGYEIWVKPEYQRRLFDDLMAAGAAHTISACLAAEPRTRCVWKRITAVGAVNFGRFITRMKQVLTGSAPLISQLVYQQAEAAKNRSRKWRELLAALFCC